MVTIAFGFMAEVRSNRWSLTGGPMGIMSIPAPTVLDGSEMTPTQYFWLIASELEAARHWYERAVAEKAKGDVYGRQSWPVYCPVEAV